MTEAIRTYETADGSWVIAGPDGFWCPGSYTTEAAARRAHRYGYDWMGATWEEWCARHTTPVPSMTLEDVAAARRAA